MLASQLRSYSREQLLDEIRRGGRFVVFEYCISLLIVTSRRRSEVYFFRPGESSTSPQLTNSLISFLFGWWGIPWGPIYTIATISTNFGGGIDLTNDVLQRMGIDPHALFGVPPGYGDPYYAPPAYGGSYSAPAGYGVPNAAPPPYAGPPPQTPGGYGQYGPPPQGVHAAFPGAWPQATSPVPGYRALPPGPPPRARGGNTLAISGLLLSFFGFLIPVVVAISGLIVSVLGLRKAKREPHVGGKGIAIAGIAVSCLALVANGALIWGLVQGVSWGDAGRRNPVTAASMKLSKEKPVAGNTREAITLGGEFKVVMDATIHTGYRPGIGLGASAPPAKIQVYCERHKDRCLFLVRIPDLKRYSTKAKGTLLKVSWSLASSLLKKDEVELAVVLKGGFLTEGVLRGRSGNAKTPVRVKGDPDDTLAVFFRPDPLTDMVSTKNRAASENAATDRATSRTKALVRPSKKENV